MDEKITSFIDSVRSRFAEIWKRSDLDGSPTTPSDELAHRLAALGQVEHSDLSRFLDGISGFECGGLLIEACRCLDHAHIIQKMSAHEHAKLTPHDFDIIVRGWNVLLSLLLARVGGFSGIPMRRARRRRARPS